MTYKEFKQKTSDELAKKGGMTTKEHACFLAGMDEAIKFSKTPDQVLSDLPELLNWVLDQAKRKDSAITALSAFVQAVEHGAYDSAEGSKARKDATIILDKVNEVLLGRLNLTPAEKQKPMLVRGLKNIMQANCGRCTSFYFAKTALQEAGIRYND